MEELYGQRLERLAHALRETGLTQMIAVSYTHLTLPTKLEV